ncbi:MAG: Cytidylate kinase [Verrucomicrobiae bacterium]|nr:Cytidylate kinase [Verrucomicrobiae bacterium]
MNESVTVIAIDGPSASGKSTVSRSVAKRLGFVHVDTGAMYRAVTWKAIEGGVNVEDNIAVIGMLHTVKISFAVVEGTVRMLIDGVWPGDAVREPRVADKVSIVAAIPEVREILVHHQRSLTSLGNLVVEGRDIGSVVFPHTPYKFYLDADPAVRAQRRQKDFAAANIQTSTDAVAKNLQTRDRIDSQRATAPLQIALGATVIDTGHFNIDECTKIVVDHIRQQSTRRGATTLS